MSDKCDHIGPDNMKCDLDSNHGGLHAQYNIDGDIAQVTEWNDNNELYVREEKGFSIPVHYDDHYFHDIVIDFLIAHAKHELNNGDVFEIRGKQRPSDDEYASEWAIAWYYLPKPDEIPDGFSKDIYALKQSPIFRNKVINALDMDGYMLIARDKV